MVLSTRSASGPRTQVLLLAAALLTAAASLQVLVLTPFPTPTTDVLVVAALLLPIAVLADWHGFHLEVGRSSYAVSVSEISLVLGMFWLPPWLCVAVRVLGGLVVMRFQRKQGPLKLTFNSASHALEATVGVSVLLALGVDLSGPLAPAWGAVLVACALASLTSACAVLAVVAMTSDVGLTPGSVRRAVAESVPTTLVAATVGFVLARTISTDAAAIGPVAVLVACVSTAYVGHMRLRTRHARLSSLYDFVHEVSTSAVKDGPVTAVLTQTLSLLRGEVAVLTQVVEGGPGGRVVLRRHLLAPDGVLVHEESEGGPADWPITRCLSDGRPLLARKGQADHAVAAYLQSYDVTDGILVAVPGQDGVTGTLFVGGRLGEHSTFEAADLTALEGLAGHASVALHNGWLLERLTYESRHDLLTTLPNRSEFQARLRELLEHQEQAAVLFMDLDRFKDVNDTLGHLAGDKLLQLVSTRLTSVLQAPATVARLGGDEFAVILPDHGPARALEVAASVRGLLQEPVDLDGLSVDVGVSIGVAVSPEHGSDVSLLMRRADIAMYDAKEREGVALYDAQRNEPSTSRLALVAQLRAGLGAGELQLHYQPQVAALDGRTVRVEALIRWDHPQRGLVSPDEFIPVAERAGMLQEITQWVLRRSLDDLVRWRRAGAELGMSINLSPRNLLDPMLAVNVRTELRRRALPASCLTLEITEATLMADPERAVQTLRQLRETGVRLSIDDFGTGYSSLAYLKHLPVDEVKVDRSFVKDLAEDPVDVAIVRAVVALADSMRLEVVAEGVEDADSLALLQALGCRYLQGYHLSRPMPEEQVLPWLEVERPWPARGRSRSLATVPTPRAAYARPITDPPPPAQAPTDLAGRGTTGWVGAG